MMLDPVRLAAALDAVDQKYERGWTPSHYARAVAAEYGPIVTTRTDRCSRHCCFTCGMSGQCCGAHVAPPGEER